MKYNIEFSDESLDRQVKSMFDDCFPEDIAFNDWYFQNIYDRNTSLVMRRADGLIVSMLQAIPCTINTQTGILNASYLYGACTHKDFRNKGLMAEVIERSFEIDRINGVDCSALIPADDRLFNFYFKFNYLPKFCIHRDVIVAGDVDTRFVLTKASEDDVSELNELYINNCKGLSFVQREFNFWQRQMTLFNDLYHGMYVLKKNDNKICACAFVSGSLDELYAQEVLTENPDYINEICFHLMKKFNHKRIKINVVPNANGGQKRFACVKMHTDVNIRTGYMNLMYN